MGQPSEHERIAAWLALPGAYPHGPSRVEEVQTHISRVFLAGDYVYKLKKPVRFDFLDFSTAPLREHACREELRLNRRLAADTYLDVLPILRRADGSFGWGGASEVVDWVVQMRRLPTELTLDALHGRGELTAEHIGRLATVLVAFYRDQPPLATTPAEYRRRCETHVRGNMRELLAAGHHLPRKIVQRIHGFQLQWLLLDPELFDQRVRAGRIVDGHGDLRPEHICLSEPIAIFDCIEFSPDFRHIDVADELAFLAAECDFLGAAWVGPQLLQAYQDQSGDRPPAVLVDFYKSYRACVRAKVAALRADQQQGSQQEQSAAEARRHLELADGYAGRWLKPLVIAVGGIAGTGKSTLAAALAERLGADLLRTDTIRQQLFGAGHHAAAIDQGIYSRESREQVYDALFGQAVENLNQGIAVVLDGTFSASAQIQRARTLANQPHSRFLAIECACRPEVAWARISRRLEQGTDASEANAKIHDIQRQRWQAWPADLPQVRVDTEQSLDEQVRQVIAALAIQRTPETVETANQQRAR